MRLNRTGSIQVRLVFFGFCEGSIRILYYEGICQSSTRDECRPMEMHGDVWQRRYWPCFVFKKHLRLGTSMVAVALVFLKDDPPHTYIDNMSNVCFCACQVCGEGKSKSQ